MTSSILPKLVSLRPETGCPEDFMCCVRRSAWDWFVRQSKEEIRGGYWSILQYINPNKIPNFSLFITPVLKRGIFITYTALLLLFTLTLNT